MSQKPPCPAAPPVARPLRADAEANRRRILAGARQVFLESGLEASMQAVARRSGISTATLYRRFPTREDLVIQVYRQEVGRCVDVVLTASGDADAWRGFATIVDELTTLDGSHRRFIRDVLSTHPSCLNVGDVRQRAEQAFADLVQRAKLQGALRADFHRADLDLVLTANAAFERWQPATRSAASRRLSQVVLRAFDARPSTAAQLED